MNNTPRVLNRILIGILGLKLLVIGLLLVLLATVPAVGPWWQQWSAGVWSGMSQLFQRTGVPRPAGKLAVGRDRAAAGPGDRPRWSHG